MGTKPVVVAVSGVKNSGKTTLISALIPLLKEAGVEVAVIKHDGHSFLSDPPDTDTGRYMASGACGAAIYDGEKFKIIQAHPTQVEELIPLFPQADLILLEGFKHTLLPKLELVREGNSQAPVSPPEALLALVTDLPLTLPDVPTLPLNQPGTVAQFLLDSLTEEGSHG